MKSALAVLTLALALAPAWAEKADRDKPMNIEADALRYDDLQQISVFTGNVVITKGTIIIRGARVEVRQDAQGNQTAIATGVGDKLAFYRRKRDRVDEYIEGEGRAIAYDGGADTVKFSQQAVLRRYNGAALADETTGAVILYNNQTDVFTVDNGNAKRTNGNAGGRVRALLTPRVKETGEAPIAPQASPGAALRPSSTLSGEKK